MSKNSNDSIEQFMKEDLQSLAQVDPDIYKAILAELKRQQEKLNLIASENYASRAILEAQATIFTNKYAEGYPHNRYYGGCDNVDTVEDLAIRRACELFGTDWANVQPHSGSQANMAVYFALLEPGDCIMGMDLAHGGHLTHGSPVSFSGRLFDVVSYGVAKETGTINYDEVRKRAIEYKPKLIIAGASAYPRTIDFKLFHEIAHEVDAYLMVDMAHIAGLIAGGVHPSPVGYADVITSTTHKTLRGPRGGFIIGKKELGKKIDSQIFPGIQGGPLMHIIAAKAVAFKEALHKSFEEYQRQVVENAKYLAMLLKERGFVLVSGGTDNHLMLLDLTSMGITGKEAEWALGLAGITVNKNAVPFDKYGPKITSGIRIGTPAITSRGMGKKEMETIADFIHQALTNINNEKFLFNLEKKVREFCLAFPIFK